MQSSYCLFAAATACVRKPMYTPRICVVLSGLCTQYYLYNKNYDRGNIQHFPSGVDCMGYKSRSIAYFSNATIFFWYYVDIEPDINICEIL